MIVYNVQMKKYSVARARQHFSEILDSAEAGAGVMIERRGRLFSLQLAQASNPRSSAPVQSAFEWVDPTVLSGTWTWAENDKGLAFAAKLRKAPRAAQRTKR